MEPRSTSSSSIKASLIWMFSGQGVLSALQIGVLMVLARLLTPPEFGVATIFLAVAQVCAHLSTLGFGPALIQFQATEPRHVSTALSISVLGGFTAGGLMIALRGPLLTLFNMPGESAISWLFLPLCCVSGLHLVLRSLMQKQGHFRSISIIETASFVLGYAGPSIGLAALGWGPLSVIIAFILNLTLSALAFAFVLRPPILTGLHLPAARDLTRTGLGFGLSELVSITSQNLDKLMVGSLLGTAAVGLYGRASSLMLAAVHLLSAPLDAVLFPTFSAAQTQQDKMRALLHKTNLLVLLLCLPTALLMICAPKGIVVVLLGHDWIESAGLLAVFGLLLLIRTLGRAADFVLRAKGLVYRRLALTMTFCLLMAGLVVITSRFGLIGVASGVTVAFLCHGILLLRVALRELGVTWSAYLGWLRRPLLYAAGIAGLCLLIDRAWLEGSFHPTAQLFVIVAIVCVAMALPLWCRPGLVFGRDGELAQRLIGELTRSIARRYLKSKPR